MDPKQIVRDLLDELPDDVSLHGIARKVTYVAAVGEVLPVKPFPNSNARFGSYLDTPYWRRIYRFVAVFSAVVSVFGFLLAPTTLAPWTELALTLLFGYQALWGSPSAQLRRVASKRRVFIVCMVCIVSGTAFAGTVFVAFRKLPWAGPALAFAILFMTFGPLLLVRLLPRSNLDQQGFGV